MPLDEEYGPQIHSSNADLQNVCSFSSFCSPAETTDHNFLIDIQTGGRSAGSCTAALFLKPFAEGIEAKDGQEPAMKWAHLDIAGTMEVCTFLAVTFILLVSFLSFLC